MEKIVNHQSIELNWITPEQITNPKTLVLGSFNPYNEKKKLDYYYGRKSNHFWKTIAILINQEEDYFFSTVNGLARKSDIMNNRFCCMDMIDSIKFSSDSNILLNDYLNNKIYANFPDQKIWTTKTNFNNRGQIVLLRTYNRSIITTLETTNTIKRVIHTLGKTKINEASIYPKEAKLKKLGFSGFMNEIISLCERRNIEFVYKSYSPSDYAVKNGSTNREELKKFLQENLWL